MLDMHKNHTEQIKFVREKIIYFSSYTFVRLARTMILNCMLKEINFALFFFVYHSHVLCSCNCSVCMLAFQ